MISYWRIVRYHDDGCTIYQCLSCYSQWESRTAPWWSKDGSKPKDERVWNFCPVCGIKWVGQIITKEREYYPYYSRYNTSRLFPCKFNIICKYIDNNSSYTSEEIESREIDNPEIVIMRLKELREIALDNGFTCFTYKVEKCISK